LVRGDFSALYERVRKSEVNKVAPIPDRVERICAAVDMAASVLEEVLCLQRSAATACLLKRYGIAARCHRSAADAVQSHAWVEVDGRVVNDKRTPQRCTLCSTVLKRDSEKRRHTVSVQFGRWNFDGRPADREYLAKAERMLAPYGRTGRHIYRG